MEARHSDNMQELLQSKVTRGDSITGMRSDPPKAASRGLGYLELQLQVWIRVGDSKRRPLHRVTGSRPVGA